VSEFLGETAKNGCVAARRRRSRTAVAVDWPLGSGGAAASGSYQKAHYASFLFPVREQRLTEQIFAEVRPGLDEPRLLPKSGTIVDATIIAAPATKNAAALAYAA